MRSRRASAAAVLAFSVLLVSGCDAEKASVPAGCHAGEPALRDALTRAPNRVTIDGALLSECFDDTSDGDEVSDIGSAYVVAAGGLADRAKRAPEGAAALQLGYLIGATRRAAEGSQGITSELRRRLEQELLTVDVEARAFRRGLRAGTRSG